MASSPTRMRGSQIYQTSSRTTTTTRTACSKSRRQRIHPSSTGSIRTPKRTFRSSKRLQAARGSNCCCLEALSGTLIETQTIELTHLRSWASPRSKSRGKTWRSEAPARRWRNPTSGWHRLLIQLMCDQRRCCRKLWSWWAASGSTGKLTTGTSTSSSGPCARIWPFRGFRIP